MLVLLDAPARALSLPNVLTLVRIPLAGLLWLVPGNAMYIFTLGAIAAVTDMLDGRVARALRARRLARGQATEGLGDAHGEGAWLDPLCDKIFVMSAVGSVYVGWHPPVAVLGLICTRELILVPLMLTYELLGRHRQPRQLDFRAGPAGKLTTVAQFTSVAAVMILPGMVWPLAVLACVAGLVTVVVYTRRGLECLRRAGTRTPAPALIAAPHRSVR
jgi:phosphatidylglycerophosphate synthase